MSISPECPVCGTAVNGDASFYEYHVAKCADTLEQQDQPPAKRRCLAEAITEEAVCPICSLPLKSTLLLGTDTEIASHVEACLVAAGSPVLGEATHEAGIGADEDDVCPVCGEAWPTDIDRQAHAELCLEQRMAEGGFGEEEDDLMDISSFDSSDKTYAKVKGHAGIIPILDQLLQKIVNNGTSRSACLCMPGVDYINGQITDLGWGCGYRNMQMIMSAARTFATYETAFKASEEGQARSIPSIEELQILIERGWSVGFDPTGRDHFNGKLKGRRKWIGTTEVFVALTVLGIRAKIYDFPKASGRGGTHTGLTNWVQKYFEDAPASSPTDKRNPFEAMMKSNGTPVRCTDRPPLYLQHAGHSRTIVGIETMRNGDLHLLVFDPSKACPMKVRKAATADPSQKIPSGSPSKRFLSLDPRAALNLDDAPKALEPFRVSIKTLSRNKQYQILVIEPGPLLTAEERAARKVVKATYVKS